MKGNIFSFADPSFSSVISQPAIILIVWPMVSICAVLPLLWYYYYMGRVRRSSQQQVHAFFHPYCSGGGGGERVLWKIVQSLQIHNPAVQIVIFTIDPPETDEKKIREDAQRQFNVEIPHPVYLVSLEDCRDFLNPRSFLSLVLESWGTMQLAYAAFGRYAQVFPDFPPIDVYWDTTGCAFTFLVARIMCPLAWIIAYVHYPTISTDMMAWEWQQNSTSRPMYKTVLKLIYYWWFAIVYGFVGSLADLVMVNSTWTHGHIQRLWGFFLSSQKIHILYPPCRVPSSSTTTTLASSSSTSKDRARTIVSIGQFRPEKDHLLQVKAFALLLDKYPQHKQEDVKLLLIGSCRNDQDQKRVETLRKLVSERKLQDSVRFSINPPYKELQDTMNLALIGIHTMRQEHFGIGIVEMMAAGLIVVAHDSGGPKTDIVQHKRTGYLATTPEEYAEALHHALTLPTQEARILRELARASVTRFSDQAFEDALPVLLSKLTTSS